MSKVYPVTTSKWDEQLDFDKLSLWSDCETVLNRRYQHISVEESSRSRPGILNQKADNTPFVNKRQYRTSLAITKNNSAKQCVNNIVKSNALPLLQLRLCKDLIL